MFSFIFYALNDDWAILFLPVDGASMNYVYVLGVGLAAEEGGGVEITAAFALQRRPHATGLGVTGTTTT